MAFKKNFSMALKPKAQQFIFRPASSVLMIPESFFVSMKSIVTFFSPLKPFLKVWIADSKRNSDSYIAAVSLRAVKVITQQITNFDSRLLRASLIPASLESIFYLIKHPMRVW